MTAAARPPLVPRGEEKVFYDRLREHELVYQRCAACGANVFPLRTICPNCAREDLALEVSARRGTLYSFTTQHRPSHPHFADSVPYSLGLVDLDEGFRVFASIEDIAADELAVGMPVELAFETQDDELTLLRIRPRQEAS
jgi:uncharacterized OB-fold protein